MKASEFDSEDKKNRINGDFFFIWYMEEKAIYKKRVTGIKNLVRNKQTQET